MMFGIFGMKVLKGKTKTIEETCKVYEETAKKIENQVDELTARLMAKTMSANELNNRIYAMNK